MHSFLFKKEELNLPAWIGIFDQRHIWTLQMHFLCTYSSVLIYEASHSSGSFHNSMQFFINLVSMRGCVHDSRLQIEFNTARN